MVGLLYYFSNDFMNLIAFYMAPVDPLPVGKATNSSLDALKEFSRLSCA